jgi:hypothetical protein
MRKSCSFLPCLSFLLLILNFLLVSCKKDGGNKNQIRLSQTIDSFNNRYLFALDVTSAHPVAGNGWPYFTYLNYEAGRLSIRRGGYISRALFGLPDFYDTLVYDTLLYAGNTIKIKTQETDPFLVNLPANERTLTFANGLPQQRTTATDTANYYYLNNKLIKFVLTTKMVEKIFDITYDNNKNLDQINETWHDIYDLSDSGYMRIKFSDFDNAPNPFSGLGLWDDLLFRSLSANNFTSFDLVSQSNFSYTSGHFYIQYYYDANGNLDPTR